VTGLLKGIKFMDLGGGLWGFRGFTTKAGTYLVTVKATLNGNTVTQRVALKVNALPAWAKGTFNGGIYDEAYTRKGLAMASVTTAGKVTATLTYDTGKKSKGKTVYYKPTCSTVVNQGTAPDPDMFWGIVYMYFAPSAANNFPGFASIASVP